MAAQLMRYSWLFVMLAISLTPLAIYAQDADTTHKAADDANASTHAEEQSVFADKQTAAKEKQLIGQWMAGTIRITFHNDHTFTSDTRTGQWSLQGDKLTLIEPHTTQTYTFKIEGNQLTLSGGDLIDTITLLYQTEVSGFVLNMFNFSWEETARTSTRIAAITMIVLCIRLILLAFSQLSRWVVFSEVGPFKLLYRRHKYRAMTFHSLIINVIKYGVYLTALGFILRELGVNYTTYLASLSVIGLAIAFGSQGLVQDTVTGFFIIFENQFDVGDMVEISGQIGVVQELGLRMTKLRNFQGQIVVIPNRNIAVVGNFSRGALIANIEVALNSRDDAHKAGKQLRRIGEQLRQQFDGVILRPPRIGEPLTLTTGENFARMHIAIWPGQQWIIDQQLVPRIREAFARESIDIANDRIVSYYYPREYYKTTTWRERLSQVARRRQNNRENT